MPNTGAVNASAEKKDSTESCSRVTSLGMPNIVSVLIKLNTRAGVRSRNGISARAY